MARICHVLFRSSEQENQLMESLSPYRDCTTEVSIELFMLRLVDGALSSFSQLSCIMLSENLKAGYV